MVSSLLTEGDIKRLDEAANVSSSDVFPIVNSIGLQTATASLIAVVALPLSKKTASYTVVATDKIVQFTLSSSAIATLSDPALNSGSGFSIINHYSSTANLTFSRSINGDSSFALMAGESIDIYSNGTEYMVD